MDNAKLLNEYMTTISERYKSAIMDNIMLSTQVKLLTEEIEKLKKELDAKISSSEAPQ